MTETDEKSISYAFIANGVQIYTSNKGYFLVSKLVCSDCGESWYMNLTECFLCGAINPYLYTCASCGAFQSITKSSGSCSKCGSSKLYMSCPNPNCVSNKNETILAESNRLGGVFNKDSGFLIAQQQCLNCGSKHHEYKNYKIYVRSVGSTEIRFNDLEIESDYVSDYSYLIIKYKNGEDINYCLYKLSEISCTNFQLDNLKGKFEDIVSELYPVNHY